MTVNANVCGLILMTLVLNYTCKHENTCQFQCRKLTDFVKSKKKIRKSLQHIYMNIF